MSGSFYVYQYLRDDGTPYYIGKGQKDRITQLHGNLKVPCKDKRNKIALHLSESEALLLERKLTHYYGLLIDGTGILENKIHGGNASPRGMLGKKHTQETKLRISQTITGTVKTPEQRENYKKPKSIEHKEKIRQANLGRKDSEERREKNRQAHTNPEVRLLKSEKMKQIIADKKAAGIVWGRGAKS